MKIYICYWALLLAILNGTMASQSTRNSRPISELPEDLRKCTTSNQANYRLGIPSDFFNKLIRLPVDEACVILSKLELLNESDLFDPQYDLHQAIKDIVKMFDHPTIGGIKVADLWRRVAINSSWESYVDILKRPEFISRSLWELQKDQSLINELLKKSYEENRPIIQNYLCWRQYITEGLSNVSFEKLCQNFGSSLKKTTFTLSANVDRTIRPLKPLPSQWIPCFADEKDRELLDYNFISKLEKLTQREVCVILSKLELIKGIEIRDLTEDFLRQLRSSLRPSLERLYFKDIPLPLFWSLIILSDLNWDAWIDVLQKEKFLKQSMANLHKDEAFRSELLEKSFSIYRDYLIDRFSRSGLLSSIQAPKTSLQLLKMFRKNLLEYMLRTIQSTLTPIVGQFNLKQHLQKYSYKSLENIKASLHVVRKGLFQEILKLIPFLDYAFFLDLLALGQHHPCTAVTLTLTYQALKHNLDVNGQYAVLWLHYRGLYEFIHLVFVREIELENTNEFWNDLGKFIFREMLSNNPQGVIDLLSWTYSMRENLDSPLPQLGLNYDVKLIQFNDDILCTIVRELGLYFGLEAVINHINKAFLWTNKNVSQKFSQLKDFKSSFSMDLKLFYYQIFQNTNLFVEAVIHASNCVYEVLELFLINPLAANADEPAFMDYLNQTLMGLQSTPMAACDFIVEVCNYLGFLCNIWSYSEVGNFNTLKSWILNNGISKRKLENMKKAIANDCLYAFLEENLLIAGIIFVNEEESSNKLIVDLETVGKVLIDLIREISLYYRDWEFEEWYKKVAPMMDNPKALMQKVLYTTQKNSPTKLCVSLPHTFYSMIENPVND